MVCRLDTAAGVSQLVNRLVEELVQPHIHIRGKRQQFGPRVFRVVHFIEKSMLDGRLDILPGGLCALYRFHEFRGVGFPHRAGTFPNASEQVPIGSRVEFNITLENLNPVETVSLGHFEIFLTLF